MRISIYRHKKVFRVRIKKHIQLPNSITEIANLFHLANKELFVVGGAVRDAVLGKNPKDFDLATNATPDEVISILNGHFHMLEIGKAFGVVAAITEDFPTGVEIATFRKDIGKGRRPESVEFTTIEGDVQRRDLTINALFYDINTHEIVDLVGGLSDITYKIIRTVGSPHERFSEDPLRKLRAVRFMIKLGFTMEDELFNSLMDDNSLTGVSSERIRNEFMNTVLSDFRDGESIQAFCEFDYFPQIFPGLKVTPMTQFSQNFPVLLANLLQDNDWDLTEKTLNKLNWSTEEIRETAFLLSLEYFSNASVFDWWKRKKSINMPDETIREFWKNPVADSFLSFDCVTNGQDLIARGFKGAEIATEMRRIEAERFETHLA